MSTKGDALMWSQMDDASGLQLLAEASDREVLDLVRRLARAATHSWATLPTFTRGGVVEPVDVDLQRLRGRIWEVQHSFSCPDDAMDHSWRDHPWEDAEHQKEAEEEADAIIGTLGAERLLALRRHSAAVAASADRSWTPSPRIRDIDSPETVERLAARLTERIAYMGTIDIRLQVCAWCWMGYGYPHSEECPVTVQGPAILAALREGGPG